jgi:ribonuclease H / adenosylcobalamin/alpha-ribazole phosphatase
VTRRLVVEADGGSRGNPGPAGYGCLVRDARSGEVLAEVSEALGKTTNNVAEYSGLIAGLRAAVGLAPGADTEVRMDSKLVVEQMSGRWQIKHPALRPLAAQARQASQRLGRVTYTWVPRARNSHADRLANQAMDAAAGRDRDKDPHPATAGGAQARGSQAPGPGTRAARPGLAWAASAGVPTTTLLLRHGETPLSAGRRFAGRGDIPLTETGIRQAHAAAARLAARGGIDAIISSPLQRARATATAVAQATGLALTVDAAWAETDFGEWEGLSYAETATRWPGELAAWLSDTGVAPPGGESFAATTSRVLAAQSALLAAHAGRCVLVVSHVTPIKVLLRHALLAGPQSLRRMFLDVASLCEIEWYPDGSALVRSLNDTAHLPPPEDPPSAYAGSYGGRAGRAAAPGS